MHKRRLQSLINAGELRATHPGVLLRAELTRYNITQQEFASTLGISYQRLNGILNGLRSVTPDTALLLSKVFDIAAATWLQQQMYYDLALALAKESPDTAMLKRVADLKSKISKSEKSNHK